MQLGPAQELLIARKCGAVLDQYPGFAGDLGVQQEQPWIVCHLQILQFRPGNHFDLNVWTGLPCLGLNADLMR